MKPVLYAAAAIILGSAAVLPAQAQPNVNIIVREAPPPPRYEVVPAPRRGYVWAPGYWGWNGRRHVWVQGHWERVRPGYAYHRPEWQHADNGWRLNQGGWRRGDRDGDGVPDRFDRRPNNPERR